MAIAITDIINYAPAGYLARQNGRPQTWHIQGQPGCGKSALIETVLPNLLEGDKTIQNLFEKMGQPMSMEPTERSLQGPHIHWSTNGNVAVITELLSTMESIDLRGPSLPQKDPETKQWSAAWIRPSLVDSELAAYAAGARIVIILLDEFGQSDQMMQKAGADVSLNGRIGQHALKKTTWVILASNRIQDGAGANKILSIINNRVCTFDDVYMPLEVKGKRGFREYMIEQKWDPIMMDAAEFFYASQMFATAQPTKEGPFLTIRSFTSAQAHVNTVKRLSGDRDPTSFPFDNKMLEHAIVGNIGDVATKQLYAYLAVYKDMPKLVDIVADPTGVALPSTQRMDVQYALTGVLISGADVTNIQKLWTCAMRLSKPLQVRVADNLLAKAKAGNLLNNDPSFNKWMQDNLVLLSSATA